VLAGAVALLAGLGLDSAPTVLAQPTVVANRQFVEADLELGRRPRLERLLARVLRGEPTGSASPRVRAGTRARVQPIGRQFGSASNG
jgi:hypothetical protein